MAQLFEFECPACEITWEHPCRVESSTGGVQDEEWMWRCPQCDEIDAPARPEEDEDGDE